MDRKSGPEVVVDRDERGWESGELSELEPAANTGEPEAEDGVSVAVDDDLDDIDAAIDPDFTAAEGWCFPPYDPDEDDNIDDDPGAVAEDDDEAEMQLLFELGIDLDAPDCVEGFELTVDLGQDDPIDDSVAA